VCGVSAAWGDYHSIKYISVKEFEFNGALKVEAIKRHCEGILPGYPLWCLHLIVTTRKRTKGKKEENITSDSHENISLVPSIWNWPMSFSVSVSSANINNLTPTSIRMD